MCCCEGICNKCWAIKWIVLGIILILVRLYTTWDIWVVLGALFVLKGILKLVKPTCGHSEEKQAEKKKK